MTLLPWHRLTEAQRDRALDAEDDLVLAVIEGRQTDGWHGWEGDHLASVCQAQGIVMWPALRDRILRAASE